MEVLETTKIPALVKNEVKSLDAGAEVILFGSRARGDWRKDSDWDFLILLDGEISEPLKRDIRDRLYEVELETEEVISTIIENKKDWLRYEITPLYKNIKKEGKEV